MEESSELAEKPWGTLQYKRQKKQTPKKAGDKAGKDSKKGAKQNTESMKVAEFKVVYGPQGFVTRSQMANSRKRLVEFLWPCAEGVGECAEFFD